MGICAGGGEICAVEAVCDASLAIDVRYTRHGGHHAGSADALPLGKDVPLEDCFPRETAVSLCDHIGH